MAESIENQTGLRKVAILLVALGAETAAEILKELETDEVERIVSEVSRVKQVDSDVIQPVINEFQNRMASSEFVQTAGAEYARQLLNYVVGPQKAQEMVSRLGRGIRSRPFESLRTVDASQLSQLIQDEQPQTIAMVISHLPPVTGANVLSSLPPAVQADVATRIATMNATSPEVVSEVENVIQMKMSSMGAQDVSATGGTKALVSILNQVDRSTEKIIMEGLQKVDAALAETIKDQMFVFEDIATLDDRTIQIILREVEQDDLRLALKGVSDGVREAILRNVSSRAAEALREDIENMGPVRLRDVEAAQQKIVGVTRRLEDGGQIVTRHGGEDQVIE